MTQAQRQARPQAASSSTSGTRHPDAHRAPRAEDIPLPRIARENTRSETRPVPEVQLPQWWLRRLSWWHRQATQLAEEKRQLTIELVQTRSELQSIRDMYANLEPGAAQESTLAH
eukprot:12911945-Prorocentrum_lima.AAC.1